MKKYKLVTTDTKIVNVITLYRIKALMLFNDVNVGDLGGYVENENNLDHEGNAWVYDNAHVFGNAWVSGDARVSDNAWVYGNARVSGNAYVYGNALVYE